MRLLDRYLMKEITGPLVLGFLAYTFILMMQFLFRSAEMIIRRGVPGGQVGELLLWSMPNIVVLTIPMAQLFAILVSVGRLSTESELTAMRASGVSLFSLYRPILLLSLLLTGINMVLMVYVLPRGNSRLQALNIEILTSSVARQVEPRVFYEEWEGLVIYVFEAPQDEDRWKGVFLADTAPGADNQITVAEWGKVRIDPDERLILELENAVSHKVDFNEPDEYHISSNRRLERVVEGPSPTQMSWRKSLRALTVGELREQLREPNQPEARYNLARVEMHKKFSIPVACAVFALIGLPLGFGKQKGGRATGFAISIGVILIYYVIMSNGEEAARVGKIDPWLAMWLPNLLFLMAGALLLFRKNRDKSLILHQVDDWVRGWLSRLLSWFRTRRYEKVVRRAQQRLESRQVVVKLPKLRLAFPNTLDRYVAILFTKILALVALSGTTLFLIADLTERIDDILANDISTGVVWDYYKYLSLQIFYELAPMAVLVTVLVIFGLLSRSNEVVAAKALGVSLYRLSVPALMAALVVVALCGFLQAKVLPVSNQEVAKLDDLIRGKSQSRSYRRADRHWLFGQGRYIYNYLHYDGEAERLDRLQVFEFDEAHRMSRRLYSAAATYLGDGWRFDQAWKRSFERTSDGPTVTDYSSPSEPVIDRYPETPDYFESEYKTPDAMSYSQLERYIKEIRESGQAVPELEVELYNKVGYPVVCFVMALVALPFSFRMGRRGALYGVGLGLVLGMVFLAVFAFSRTLGEIGALPPILAVWSPSLAFAIFSAYMFLGVET